MEQKREKKYIVGSILCGLLTAFGIAASVISLIGGSNGQWILIDCISIALFALISFYAFIGYKKPHWNLLKYIILFRTLAALAAIPIMVQLENTINILALMVEIGLICYVAGRLAKAKESLILMLIIVVCEVICHVPEIASGLQPLALSPRLSTGLTSALHTSCATRSTRKPGLSTRRRNNPVTTAMHPPDFRGCIV